MNRDAFELVDLREPYAVRRVPPIGDRSPRSAGPDRTWACAFSPDGASFYYGSANEGRILVLDVATDAMVGAIDLNTDGFADSFAGDLALSRDGRRLFVVDQFNYRLVTVDVESRKVVQSVRVGRNPFAVTLSPDERFAWVSNVGMFEYPLVPGVTRETRAERGLPFPAYGVPSKEAEEGVAVGGIRVPGLGSPNHPDAMSVFGVDLAAGTVVQRIKTGYLVGVDRDDITTVGGASPGALVAGRERVYVANATNDTISIIDSAGGAVLAEIALTVPRLEQLRGVLPFGMAVTADETRLYVACAGLNAVAVIDLGARRLEGYIPAGWFPSMVALANHDRTLIVSSAKGLGSGPNGGRGFVDPPRGATAVDVMKGTLQIVAVPDARAARAADAARHRQHVPVARDRDPTRRAAAAVPTCRPRIKHVVFIVKENRTFDQVFGSAGVAAIQRADWRRCAGARMAPVRPRTSRRTTRRSRIASRCSTTSTATAISRTPVIAGSSASIRTSGSR